MGPFPTSPRTILYRDLILIPVDPSVTIVEGQGRIGA
jgi:hypothetical protein